MNANGRIVLMSEPVSEDTVDTQTLAEVGYQSSVLSDGEVVARV